MDQSIVIKGNKNGIVVVLDPDLPFSELTKKAAEKFSDSSKFLGDAKMAVAFEGRKLHDYEQMELLRVINANSDLDVVCIVENNPERDAIFGKALNEKLMELSQSTGQFYKGNLRSGQALESETSVIVIGDVNPGANIISKGNIIILGALKGNAFAGAAGNEKAFVLALEMSPVQIRIADTIARAPDHPSKDSIKEAKIAFLENRNIYIEPLNKKVLNEIQI